MWRVLQRGSASLLARHQQPLRFQQQLQVVRSFADRQGVVKFFNPERGFGFISSESEDFFVHYTGINQDVGFRSLGDGEEVEFDVEVDSSGKQRAVRVTGPGGAPVKGSQRLQSNDGFMGN